MGLAEEEVLIRDDSGLLLDVGDTRVPKSQEWTKKLTKTICLSLGFLVLGLCVAIPGPTLLDLEDQVKATTFEMMIVFASRSLGYLLGALLGGVLFDCFDKQLLLFCTLLVSSVATVAIPWSLTLVVMATMFALQGITMGALDTGGNVFCIQLWGKKNPPYIQTLHFAFGIGAFVAPLLAKPFLSHGGVVTNTSSIVQGNIPVAPFLTNQLHVHPNITKRSPEFSYLHFNKLNTDLQELVHGKEEGWKRNKRAGNSAKFYVIEGDHDLTIRKDIFRNSKIRFKRQSGDDEGGYSGWWKWKRYVSKRDTTNGNPDDPVLGTTTTPKADDAKKPVESPVTPINDEAKEAGTGPGHADTEATSTGSTADNVYENKKESESLVPETSQNSEDLSTSSDEVVNKNVSDTFKAKSNISVMPNGTNGVTSTEMNTLITTQSTTTEVKFHKPSAATDTNREPATADGKVIHKPKIPANTGGESESDSGSVKEEVSTTAPGISNNSKAENISQLSSNNSGGASAMNISNISSTLKPKNSSEATNNKSTETVSPDGTIKSSIKPNTTTILATKSTTKKPTTTTTPPPPTTTTTQTTTPSTTTTQTTTAPSTTTTTTQKTTTTETTTTRIVTTTEKLTTTTVKVTTPKKPTPPPATQEKATESSTKKTTALNQPTEHNDKNTNTTVSLVTTTPKVSSTSSSVTVVSLTTNSTLSDDKLSTTEVSMKPESTVDSFLNNAIHAVKNISKIQFAYLITGLALFLIAILFLVLYCKDKRRLTPGRDFEELERFRSPVTSAKAVLIVLLGVFFFCYMGLEVTFGALVTTFAVDFNKWPKEQGAMAAAIFWGSLATGRGLSIFLSKCCGPRVMLIIDLIFMIIGGLVLSIGIHVYDKLLWLGTLILGLGMSSAFPAGISWAENYFHLTGKSTAVFVIGSALGQMIVPVVTGYLYENLGAIVLMYSSLVLSILSLVIFILMQCVAVGRGITLKVQERNGFLPLEDDDDENLEMDDLIHFDKSQARSRHDKRGGGNAEYHTLISDLDDD
ncbi:uncharacterized protein LOC123537019 [Mercenaria mercenaria]|uniref:uncharacterized protein LOC123537019 n=1 Tax=Mercenaria mercenaria TaxID=6596 RepID=UPI00234E8C6A|nr:uncharacterized protein LOC123537019 [Mercenaria mercenaria]